MYIAAARRRLAARRRKPLLGRPACTQVFVSTAKARHPTLLPDPPFPPLLSPRSTLPWLCPWLPLACLCWACAAPPSPG